MIESRPPTEQQRPGAFPLAPLEFVTDRVIETSGTALSSSHGKGRASDGKGDAIQNVGIHATGIPGGEALSLFSSFYFQTSHRSEQLSVNPPHSLPRHFMSNRNGTAGLGVSGEAAHDKAGRSGPALARSECD